MKKDGSLLKSILEAKINQKLSIVYRKSFPNILFESFIRDRITNES